jgi:hypothetical protein
VTTPLVAPEAIEVATATVTATAALTTTGQAATTPTPTVLPRVAISLPTALPTTVRIAEVTLLEELIEEAAPMMAELSPDGSSVAWLLPATAQSDAQLCLADVSGEMRGCFAVSGYQGLPYRLVWSPDSEWLAFSEDPAAQALESDIWLFNTRNGELINRTDEGTAGRYAEVAGEVVLDYLPMWDPATGYLYFWRSAPDAPAGFGLTLMRLDPNAQTEAQVVRSFGRALGDGMVRFGWQRFYLQGPSAIAPDGSQLAVAMAPAQEMNLSASQVLWLIDLVDVEAAPRQLATALAWQEALPQWSDQPAVARGLHWTEDGQGIVVAALSSDLRLPLLLVYYVDVATGDVTPVEDFSNSRDRAAFFRVDPASGRAPRFDVPWTVALAPNANVVLLVTDLGGTVRILGAPLPPTGAAPMPLYEHVSPGYEVWTRSSGSDKGTLLVYGMLLESAE